MGSAGGRRLVGSEELGTLAHLSVPSSRMLPRSVLTLGSPSCGERPCSTLASAEGRRSWAWAKVLDSGVKGVGGVGAAEEKDEQLGAHEEPFPARRR
jgi:hypothetical protein